MLEFMKKYFPKMLSFIVAVLIFLQILPSDYDPFRDDNTSASVTQVIEDPTDPEADTTTVETDPDDPSTWTVSQIVGFYKTAAEKTEKSGCRSKQTMEMVSLEGAPAMFKGTIEKAINSNSKEFDGLTGGYENLSESNLQLATARKNGANVILTMIAKDQTDGVSGKEGEGTVGHLVYVIDGVDQVLKETGMTGSFPEGSARLDYKHAYANNIVVNTQTGLIENGEWGYDVFVYLNGCSVRV
ncbi:MAG: hypothetical protein IJS17_00530 [Clostridia bacterium]|nr:hypothetical protein [Clostridia bacterium]